ncbi:MAG: cryptochrome/photolyase family protein [Verrucomicrobiota bacterium JB023]|nr:cryptochrome/photolyase family protein [Verrucomicrobiota bacterium JB023]
MPADATLVFPHQLFGNHPAISPGRPVYLLEDPLFFGTDRHQPLPRIHPHKRTLHRASLLAYQDELEEEGHRVIHLRLPAQEATTADLLAKLPLASLKRIHLCDPADYLVERRLRRFAKKHGLELIISDSPNFLSPPDFLDQQFPEGKKPFMARFYQKQRQRMGILMDDGEPVGGQYSFDEENRKKLPKNHAVPAPGEAQTSSYLTDAQSWVEERFGEADGLPDFPYPVTRQQAVAWLDKFLAERFREFGPYEDAISRQHRILFHSVLTPCLNIGLLSPNEVVEKALAYGQDGRRKIPLNSLEGFIRQVIGWREFMKAMYDRKGVTMRTRNYWDFSRKMPSSFYDGTTGIPPIDDTIARVRETGYCHHIERLMVLGNFMLLCRIHPDEVYRWFMELFIDAYDWVMVPNVYGMSQFADGGLFTTKPYLSGSNYIRKMSDYGTGDWCPVWDGLYWTFIGDHSDFFESNHRLAMMARTYQKMAEEKRESHRKHAEDFLSSLD